MALHNQTTNNTVFSVRNSYGVDINTDATVHCTDDIANMYVLVVTKSSKAVLASIANGGIILRRTTAITTNVFVSDSGTTNYLGSTLNLMSTSPAVSSSADAICNNITKMLYTAELICALGTNAGSKVSSSYQAGGSSDLGYGEFTLRDNENFVMSNTSRRRFVLQVHQTLSWYCKYTERTCHRY